MKALLSTATGGPETLTLGELPRPTAGKGQIVIDVKACAVNFPDVLMIADRYQTRPPRPFAPGLDVAGDVEQVGPGVDEKCVAHCAANRFDPSYLLVDRMHTFATDHLVLEIASNRAGSG